jgi:hypothetical protein
LQGCGKTYKGIKAMDRCKKSSWMKNRFLILLFTTSLTGCVTQPLQVPTVWDKLGITGGAARLRDGFVNRNGNFPGLEKKPPVLKLADPANLAEGKPEVIKTAAKIKQDQDLKKQKIKAIKFLAEVSCGCYNKDDAVAKAFIEALNDCDPDVRMAAIEGIMTTAGNCAKCSACSTTCCTEDVIKKLQEIACGRDDRGCFKEPSAEIRSMAAAAIRRCPCLPAKPIEEIPAPPPEEIEEIKAPEAQAGPAEDDIQPKATPKPAEDDITPDVSVDAIDPSSVRTISYRVSDGDVALKNEDGVTAEVQVAQRRGLNGEFIESIGNRDHFIPARVSSADAELMQLSIELPDLYEVGAGWTIVVSDVHGNCQVGKVTSAAGRQINVSFGSEVIIKCGVQSVVQVGLVRTQP